MADTDDTVTISRKEYDQLQKDADMLNALEACGVDNWEGYSEAHKYLKSKRRSRSRKEHFAPADDTTGTDAIQARSESW